MNSLANIQNVYEYCDEVSSLIDELIAARNKEYEIVQVCRSKDLFIRFESNQSIRADLEHQAWVHIIQILNPWQFLTLTRRRELQEKIYHVGSFEPLSHDAINKLVNVISEHIRLFMKEKCGEVISWLISPYRVENKTTINNRMSSVCGRKVIMEHCFYEIRFGHPVLYEGKIKLEVIDSMFHLLNGSKSEYDYGDIYQALMSSNSGEPKKTPFYEIKWWKNGNIHLKFTDLGYELLKKIQFIAVDKTQLAARSARRDDNANV